MIVVLTTLVTHEEKTENVPHSWACLLAFPWSPALSPSSWVRLVSVGFQTLPLLILWLCEPPLPSEEPWVVLDVFSTYPELYLQRGPWSLSSLFLLGSLVPGHWRDLLRFLEKA